MAKVGELAINANKAW